MADYSDDIRQARLERWKRISIYARWFCPNIVEAPMELQEQAMRREFRLWGWVLGAMTLYLFVSTAIHWNDPPPPPSPSPTYISAGTVSSVSLHPTFLSTKSQIITTAGSFAVYGAASAGTGDKAEIKTEYYRSGDPIPHQSLCITSSFKTACYQIL